MAAMAAAGVSAQTDQWTDLTEYYLTNPAFSQNTRDGWTVSSDAWNQVTNYQATEFWNGTFDISQTVTLPDGHYRVSAQAFYRAADNNTAYNEHTNGSENVTAVIYANSDEAKIASVYDYSLDTNYSNNCWSPGWWGGSTYYPNGMASGSYSFGLGNYNNSVETDVKGGTLKLGIRNETSRGNNWCMLTNFKLEKKGALTYATSVDITLPYTTLTAGETLKAEATITPADATLNKVTWTSSDTGVIDVDSQGNITAKAEGQATLTATSADGKAQASVTLTVEKNTPAAGAIEITEVQSANADMFVDPSYNYGGWVELRNTTSKPLTLAGLYITDDLAQPRKYELTYGHGTIAAGGYKTIWFDHYAVLNTQVDFKLDCDGGTIYILDADGTEICSLTYPEAVTRTSYAKDETTGAWTLTDAPTPGRANGSLPELAPRLDPPAVDTDSRLFTGSLQVGVEIPDGTTLRYTTDGTTPTLTNGQESGDGQFSVSSTTTYRFRLFKDGAIPSAPVTRSYIYKDRDYTLPVISVVTDPVNLYDDTLGVYIKGVNGRPGNGQSDPCNWNMDWDRPVNFEYITADGEMAANQEVDFAMCGGWSRAWTPHSFKLKASKVYDGKNSIDYQFFADKPYLKHKTLQIRNGGNDTSCRIKDPALQTIVSRSGLNVDAQSYQPAVHFINGVYKGMLNVREPNNKHFATANYGLDTDLLDQFEMSPDSGYCQMTGNKQSFLEWYELSKNAADSATFSQIEKLVDIDEYANYMAVEMYLGSTDWPQNNVKGFRSREDGGRFRFVLFDLDFALNTTSSFKTFEGKQTYTFDYLYDKQTRITAEIEFVTIFLNMLTNDGFRQRFTDAFSIVAGSVFTDERCESIINELADRVSETLGYEGKSPYGTSNSLVSGLKGRQSTMTEKLRSYSRMKLSSEPYRRVKVSSNIAAAAITLNGQPVPLAALDGYTFGTSVFAAATPGGYRFMGWRDTSNKLITRDSLLTVSGTDSVTAVAYYVKDYGVAAPVVINELSASNDIYVNEYFKRNDWIELYNVSQDTVELAGAFISDNPDKPHKYMISAPEGVGTSVAPHGRLLIWADKLEPVSQLHASFKLSASGETVVLTAADDSWSTSFYYTAHTSKQSEGRYPDGGALTYVMNRPTIGAANTLTSLDELFDQPDVVDGIGGAEADESLGGMSLAMDGNVVSVSGAAGRKVAFAVFTTGGQTVLSASEAVDGGVSSLSLESLPSGMYIVRATAEGGRTATLKAWVK